MPETLESVTVARAPHVIALGTVSTLQGIFTTAVALLTELTRRVALTTLTGFTGQLTMSARSRRA